MARYGRPSSPKPAHSERWFRVGEIAALIAAGAFLLLVGALAVPILRLRHTVDAATQTINDVNDRTGPILGNVNTTVENVNTALTQVHTTLDGVNLQLARVDTITRPRVTGHRERGQPHHGGHRGGGQPAGQGRGFRLRRAQGVGPPAGGGGRVRAASRLKAERQAAPRGRRGGRGRRWAGSEDCSGSAWASPSARSWSVRSPRRRRRYSPSGWSARLGNPLAGLLDSVRDFVADVREGMAEREAEIYAAFEQGISLDDGRTRPSPR